MLVGKEESRRDLTGGLVRRAGRLRLDKIVCFGGKRHQGCLPCKLRSTMNNKTFSQRRERGGWPISDIKPKADIGKNLVHLFVHVPTWSYLLDAFLYNMYDGGPQLSNIPAIDDVDLAF